MNNTPTPTLIYPKSNTIWLLSENQRLNAFICDFVTTCVQKDQEIAALQAEVADLKAQLPKTDLPEGVVALPMTPAPDQQAAD